MGRDRFAKISEIISIQGAPTLADEAAAVAAGLEPYTLYKTATGELRYKLPPAETPAAPTDGDTDDDNDTFTYTGGQE